MKAKNMVFFLTAFFVFSVPQAALANNPPGPQAVLAEILILPIMVLLSLVGGGYAVLSRLRGKKSPGRTILAVVGAILAILFSWMNEGFAVIVALIFGIIALSRALQMIIWGARALSKRDPPEHLRKANPWRLIPAGTVLITTTIFLVGMPFAFVGHWPDSHWRQRSLVKFVAYQLAYANLQESRTGERRFHGIARDAGLGNRFLWFSMNVEYGADGKSFAAYMPPSSVPLYPYNYLNPQPSYYADGTGQIRMTYVYKKERCPPDAPVVLRVDKDVIKTLKDENPYVRASVADALRIAGDPKAVEALIAALKDEHWEVRSSAAAALWWITGQDLGKDSVAWQEWWEQNKESFHKGT